MWPMGGMMSESKKLPVVFLGLPVYGGTMMAETAACHETLIRQLDAHKWGVYTYRVSMADVVDTRNCMLTYWYDRHPESDYLLMVDNDMVYEWQMVVRMFKFDKPVVGCIYSKKHIAEAGADGKVNFWDITVGEPLPEQQSQPIVDGFQQWKYVGGGVLLIKREVVTAILEKFPEINDTTDPGFMVKSGVSRVIGAFDKIVTPEGRHLSEDISFCERWRQCGGEIWAAVDFTVGHRGLFTFNFNAKDMLGLDGKPARLSAVA